MYSCTDTFSVEALQNLIPIFWLIVFQQLTFFETLVNAHIGYRNTFSKANIFLMSCLMGKVFFTILMFVFYLKTV